MGEYGLTLLRPGMGILTHCNAGTIATAKYGTCLAPLYIGQEKGYHFKVFADETRPLLQGARLTAWELNQAGIDTTLDLRQYGIHRDEKRLGGCSRGRL